MAEKPNTPAVATTQAPPTLENGGTPPTAVGSPDSPLPGNTSPDRMQDLVSLEDELLELSELGEDFVELKYQERAEFLQFRRRWSMALLGVVYIIVIFDILFLIAVGLGWLSYLDEWLVRIIFIGNFIEVIGLARIVVDFLFKLPPADAAKAR